MSTAFLIPAGHPLPSHVMASPQPLLLAALVVILAACAAGFDTTAAVPQRLAAASTMVSVTVPFGPKGAPTPHTQPSLSIFKDVLQLAFQDAMTHISEAHFNGPEGTAAAPPVGDVLDWVMDLHSEPQTATAVFAYTSTWAQPLYFLVLEPEVLLTNGQQPGHVLAEAFNVIPGAVITLHTQAAEQSEHATVHE